MSDWTGYDDYGYDASSWTDYSNDLSDVSNDMWGQSIDLESWANDVWVDQGSSELYWDLHQYSLDAAEYSNDLYQASWDAWYGPVNADGYTAMDVSEGYSAYDTSFIEPASWADNSSMISDYDATSIL